MKTPRLALTVLLAASTALARPVLFEVRGVATAGATLDRLGLPDFTVNRNHPEEAPFLDFFLSRNVPFSYLDSTAVLSLSPDDRDALFALCASENWSNEPDTPEGFRPFAPPSRSFTNFYADADGKLLLSESPDSLRAALDALPALPPTLPAEGDLAIQITGEMCAARLHVPQAASPSPLATNIDTFTAGLGLDGDTAALHAVLAPLPASDLATALRAAGPIPPSTACVNLPGAIAFFAEGPSVGADGSRAPWNSMELPSFVAAVIRRTAGRPSAVTLYPPVDSADRPAAPGAFFRALAFTGIDAPSTARDALAARLAPHADAISFVAAPPYRGIPVDTLSVASPSALAALLDARFGADGATGHAYAAQGLASCSLALAWLPDGLLAALNDADSSLLHAALDATLDGDLSTRRFESSPAFQSAFPYPDAPATALAHLDLPALLALLPAPLAALLPPIPSPCPVDFFACVAPDHSSHVIRLRAPADLVRTLASPPVPSPSPENADADPSSLSPSPDGGPSAPLPWDSPTPFVITPDTITSRDIDAESVAFWREFLLAGADETLAPSAGDLAPFLALPPPSREDAAALFARLFPDASLDAPPPGLPLPWAHAAAALLHAAGRTDAAVAAWLAVATAGDDAPSPVPDADRPWQDLFASAMAADRYLSATTNWTDPATLARRDALRPLGARRAALVVSRLNPSGLRGRVFLCLLCPDNANFAFPENPATPSPLAAAFAETGESNAVASVLLAFSEIRQAWQSRGGGWASSVTPEGWQGFHDHMEAGIAWADRARALEPRWPEPVAFLIELVGSSCVSDRPETVYDLARRCLECQIDYTYAIHRLRVFMRPRWGNGAPAEAIRTLRALVDIPRPDTAMPFKSLEILDYLVDDQLSRSRPSDRRLYARAGYPVPLDLDARLWPAFRDMFERYLAAPEPGVPRPDVLRAYLQTAARFRDPAPALDAIDRLPPDEAAALWTDSASPSVPRGASLVGALGIDGQRIAAHIDRIAPGARARHAAALATLDQNAAQAALGEIQEKLKPVSFLVPLHDAILQRMARDQSIAFDWEPGGDWESIDRLRPITFYREGAPALRLPTGGWLFWDQSDARGASIDFWRKKTADAAADFTVLSLPAGADPAAAGFFVRLHAGPAFCVGVAVNPFAGTARAYLTDPSDFHVRHPFADASFDSLPLPAPSDAESPPPVPSVFRLRIRCENGLLDAWLDGAPLFTSVPVPEAFPRQPDYHPAFGTTSPLPGPVYAVDRIRLARP